MYACADGGAYAETLLVTAPTDGAEIYGGFRCADWSWSAGLRAMVQAPTPIALSIEDATHVVIENVEVSASDAVDPGSSSFGAWVRVHRRRAAERGAAGRRRRGRERRSERGGEGRGR